MAFVLNEKLATRWQDEDLALHWRVDETKESFKRLLYHLEVRSNFKPYFEEAITHLNLSKHNPADGLVVADIGAGVCWTAGMLAKQPQMKLIYALDPSDNRLRHARFVMRHFGVEDKVKIIRGTFLQPNVPEKVDLLLLCGSLHHCYDEQIPGLFSNIRQLLKPDGRVLIANEHYVDRLWSMKRLLSYIKHFKNRRKLFYYSLEKLRAPHPFDGEHWRTKKELKAIFRDNGFTAQFFVHRGDLCKDKPFLYQRLGWHYYHAVLCVNNRRESTGRHQAHNGIISE